MSSEVQPANDFPRLTMAQLDQIARETKIAYCLGMHTSFDGPFAQAVESATREPLLKEIERLNKVLDWNEMALGNNKFAYDELSKSFDKIGAERDSAQAEAKALRSALGRLESNFVLMLAGKPVRDVEETLAEVRAALTTPPGNATQAAAIFPAECPRCKSAVPGIQTQACFDAQAAGAREPLSEEQMESMYDKASAEVYRCRHDYYAGILDAERAHGIASPAAELKKD